MTFEEILPALREGEIVRRESYNRNLIIFMQNPAYIPIDYIPNMQSLPNKAKKLLNKFECSIWYRDQFLIYDFNDNVATYCILDGDDINATDWEIVDINTYNPYE